MNYVRMAITALPWLRRLWRVLPGPLRIPLLLVGAAYWLYKKVTGREQEIEQRAAAAPDRG